MPPHARERPRPGRGWCQGRVGWIRRGPPVHAHLRQRDGGQVRAARQALPRRRRVGVAPRPRDRLDGGLQAHQVQYQGAKPPAPRAPAMPTPARVPSAHALPRPRRQAQYPFEGKKKFLMLCAGTGITPMYQARVARHAERASRRGVETCGGRRAPRARLISARSSMCVPRGHRRCGSSSARRAMTARW